MSAFGSSPCQWCRASVDDRDMASHECKQEDVRDQISYLHDLLAEHRIVHDETFRGLVEVCKAANRVTRWIGTANAGCGDAHRDYADLEKTLADLAVSLRS